jgi:hypothetical protein
MCQLFDQVLLSWTLRRMFGHKRRKQRFEFLFAFPWQHGALR